MAELLQARFHSFHLINIVKTFGEIPY